MRNSKELLEKILGGTPAAAAGRAMGRLADVKAPGTLLAPAVSLYSAVMGVDTSAYQTPEGGFSTFNSFFGRRLMPGMREICADPGAIVSPCDGNLSSFGTMDRGGAEFTIKRSCYSLASLLGDQADAETFKGGTFAVIYLHPRDYHRVHAPFFARLAWTRHIPGTRYPVTAWAERLVDNIYDKNERMVFLFELPNGGKAALVMVAALGVGNIESPFHPGSTGAGKGISSRRFEPSAEIKIGEEIGGFLLGSTVVLIGSKGAYELDLGLKAGVTQLGRRIAGAVPAQTKP